MKDAVRRVAADTGLSRNELYAAALAAQREDP
jgi:DNA-binding phage protein